MFLEIHTDSRRKNAYSYGLFREPFRENGPVRHRTRGRVTGLSHEQKLPPLFAADGAGEDRRWTWAGVLERLKGIRRQTVTMNGTAVTLTSRPDDEQQELLKLLEVAP